MGGRSRGSPAAGAERESRATGQAQALSLRGDAQRQRCTTNRPAAVTPVAWSAAKNLALPEWVDQGKRLGSIGRSVGWWIGDWLRYGNATFGERYARASRITGYDVQTLMNMVYVASRFDISRRRENLSWSHHAELTGLDVEDQERWLDLAERERMSVRCLRQEVRRERLALEAAEETQPRRGGRDHVVCPECGCRFGRIEIGATAGRPALAAGA